MTTNDCLADLDALRAKWGYFKYYEALKIQNRRRLESDHGKREHFSQAKRTKIFMRHGGRCHICGELIDPKSNWHVDHVNVNLSSEEYNQEKNLAPTHAGCNESKGARDLVEQSKHSGRTVREQLGDEL